MKTAGIYQEFSQRIDAEANRQLHAFSRRLRKRLLAGVVDIIPAYRNVYIEYDSEVVGKRDILRWLEQNRRHSQKNTEQKMVRIPLTYNGRDLAEVARVCKLSVDEVIRLHSSKEYRVYAMGFTPGFPYMAEVDEAIRVPRKGVPLPRVPARSVAIADAQTGIYPFSSPGAWNIIGQAAVNLFDPNRPKAFLLEPGDRVQFEISQPVAPPELKTFELISEQGRAYFSLLEPGFLDIFVDRGRFLAGHLGLSRSGALDGKLAEIGNALLANDNNAVLLEMHLAGPKMLVLDDLVVAFVGYSLAMSVNGVLEDAFKTVLLRKGDVVSFQPGQAGGPSYLAIAGGFAAQRFLGSSSVDLRAYIGRPLKAADVLFGQEGAWARAQRSFRPYYRRAEVTILKLKKGPQYDAKIAKELMKKVFTVGAKDRMGIRFEGDKVPGYGIISEAVPLGALQLSSDGLPMLLLNDRGTIGGYAKPGILRAEDFSKAAQLAPGDKVRFIFS